MSTLPALMPSSGLLLTTRIIQGIGMACYSMTLRAIIADTLEGKKLLQAYVLFSLFWGLGPIIGPVLGGYFQDSFD